MQVIVIGKWSKALKRWQTVLSLRRPRKDAPARRRPAHPSPPPNGAA
jgi:hypothetical protein